jgi:hypothetical protein
LRGSLHRASPREQHRRQLGRRPCLCPLWARAILVVPAGESAKTVLDLPIATLRLGERFWIYRAGDGEDTAPGSHRWFLHGIFG